MGINLKTTKSKKIEFLPSADWVELHVEPPVPASKAIPEWWKNLKRPDYKNLKFGNVSEHPHEPEKILKMCVPFTDAITAGYIQRTWNDIWIELDEDKMLSYHTSSRLEQLRIRKTIETPVEDWFYNIEFTWVMAYQPKVPKGYSVWMGQPLNSIDSPFYTTNGIIDADKFYHGPLGNIPFYIKRGFTGLIPAGTPMYQIIPFKREDWYHEVPKYDKNWMAKNELNLYKKFVGTYKNNMWTKKRYE